MKNTDQKRDMKLTIFCLFVFGIPRFDAASPGKRDRFRFYPLRNGFNRVYRLLSPPYPGELKLEKK